MKIIGRWLLRLALILVLLVATIYLVRAFDSRNLAPLQPEHRVSFEHEFRAELEADTDWDAYLELEQRLFQELLEKIPPRMAAGARVDRYSPGSVADPNRQRRNWNRSYVLTARAGAGSAVLLHGLTDSPYSMRSTAELLAAAGYHAVVPRMPGHGHAPGGLRSADRADWLAATRIALRHGDALKGPGEPLLLVGYSNGALLAVRYALECLDDPALPCPDRIVLLSPAIDVTPFARLADWHSLVSWTEYFEKFQWESVAPEVDPFKFTSFPKSPGWQVFELARDTHQMLAERHENGRMGDFPPVLAFQSLVDDTVDTMAVVDKLFVLLPANGSELIVYDVNRRHLIVDLMGESPIDPVAEATRRAPLDFAVTVVTNAGPDTPRVKAVRLAAGEETLTTERLDLSWPFDVYSLSHIALPFRVDDPVYGGPESAGGGPMLGALAPRGERKVLRLTPNYFLRLRHNPFFDYQQRRLGEWLKFENALAATAAVAPSHAHASGEPSSGAEGMPGAEGTFEFMPTDWMEGTTSWWKDSDGVAPGVAGCHVGTDAAGKPNGRMFGEACLPNGLLVESNPGANELHSHANDIGHPDTFDCNAWCVGKGSSKGACTVAAAPPCEQSAKCMCD